MPDDTNRTLKARAALQGLTSTESAQRSLEESARHPSREELVAELSTIELVDTGETATEALVRVRDDLA